MKNKIIKYIKIFIIGIICIGIQMGCQSCQSENDINEIAPPVVQPVNVEFYLTKADQSVLFTKQTSGISAYSENNYSTITVNSSIEYQTIDGFGYTLTGGSAMHINNMSSTARANLLNELFKSDGNNIGVSYLRISIGASDLDAAPFSYDDLPLGETDVELNKFSIYEDQKNLIPVLKEILAINPNIKIMGSPWSPPTWMKTNQNSKGGSLKPEYYDVYANYFVKYIQAMAAEGIIIDAITVQNEPLHPGNNPSLLMEASDQAEFIKNHLGPTFETAGITTKIIIYDHNADRTDYPISVLNDIDANKYIDGSAFHLYGGNINDLSKVKTAYPDKNLYFTEQWVGSNEKFEDNLKWHTRELIIGATRNWCKTVLEWNLAANSNLEPHTDGGCTECLGALTIDGNTVTKNVAYYIIAHASKFVRPDSKRISSNYISELPNVAFKAPNGDIIVIVLNNTGVQKTFNINAQEDPITTTLDAGSVGTYIW
ncbi:glycoside hydrolase family 30 protein [Formosa sp. PL04]|uniref:glycoside hydrolase family 30 protein n=1 Tax=Formosa sp. PL04 TaxID=3081755 RepID=UPI00298137E7|nr:glycoside hydrolase family 30 beta sandwich domain-containing protein [Formosa sp. PL04]MDW5288908.1 glycoside hydrolase family 30 beta sandwich domain-containing protein [Formosa sp. PL04]